MRLLYVAAGIDVPGTHGGSIHTWEVAQGLAQLGHEIYVAASPPTHRHGPLPRHAMLDGVRFHYIGLPKPLSLLSYPWLARLIRRLAPAALMERYYNLAGAGVLAAHRHGVPALLEVNALIVDPPDVFKRRLDDRLGWPLRRWAVRQCRMAARIVTPLAVTVPPEIERSKVVELPWGANVEHFTPEADHRASAALRQQLNLPATSPIAIFAGSFRAWHGVQDFVRAAVELLDQGAHYDFVLIGDGPERSEAEQLAARYADRFRFVGSVPHADVPRYLALAQVGVAPFNTSRHPALESAGFFWSPLKIYEYMAMGLPVVTPAIHPLDATIREGTEGAVYPQGDTTALATAIRRVLDAPDRETMGLRARERVVRDFSWQRHCRELEQILQDISR